MAQPPHTSNARASDASRASPSRANSNGVAGVKRKRTPEQKFYAVKAGKTPGIYNTWPECLSQVKGHKGAQYKAFPSVQEAQAFIDGKLPSKTASANPKYYAVQNGKVPGVYTDWPQAQAQIRGVSKPKYKKFDTRAEAEAFVAAGKTRLESDLTPEEEIRRLIVRNSAPGLQLNGTFAPTDKDGNPYDIAQRPLPTGAEDGYDPNITLAADGTLVDRTAEEKSRTKKIIKEKSPPGMLRIYTDGSSLRNGQAGARAGVGVYFGPQDPKNVSEALKGSKQTNQRAELTAILRALDIAPRHRDVTIYTDSKYAIDCVTNWYRNWQRNGWLNAKGKAVENKDLVVDIRDRIDERDELKKATFFVWVKGHQDNAGNIAADKLAVEGAAMGRGVEDEEKDEGREAVEYAAEDAPKGRRSSTKIGTAQDDEDDETKAAFEAMERAMDGEDDWEFT
ncbi:hypothetical protein HRR83_009004 [Exophiala dermatitidis]|uniref:Ribonuclease H n=1 Tax=Exophiala dermatitidis TaxID=5970 RepID=A0AAN6EKG7_EXODE|nr:hypothetical protein HRR76_009565 [Exophiala dermatitidis]KAJ4533176.1 hypothetical protein HRR77_008889 [Exophiala dermatitidis]KAJ4562548.1 hypothetical protein HRR81_008969 [Exophiala dermatitidis]KAJ4564924.1 hypothetical protein HRR82_009075 [Exophiala dermatitidis]KAJ4587149.1 hypothetical protein HRR83_009004 [Exophiala dermatitidis]